VIFVDTGAWFALFVPGSVGHDPARAWMSGNHDALLTTDYVIDETLTLLRARRQPEAALAAGRAFFETRAVQIHYVSNIDVYNAWEVFSRFADKDWSFTDCTSKVVIEKFGISKAFTFDHHFRQFGSLEILP
jgi:predicted nucleic acid-binding protein